MGGAQFGHDGGASLWSTLVGKGVGVFGEAAVCQPSFQHFVCTETSEKSKRELLVESQPSGAMCFVPGHKLGVRREGCLTDLPSEDLVAGRIYIDTLHGLQEVLHRCGVARAAFIIGVLRVAEPRGKNLLMPSSVAFRMGPHRSHATSCISSQRFRPTFSHPRGPVVILGVRFFSSDSHAQNANKHSNQSESK